MNPLSKQLTEQAMQHHQSGRLQLALPLYQQAIAEDAANSDAHQFLGLLYLHAGKPQDGIACIRRAIAVNPEVAPYYDNLGAALESVGDFDGALESFQAADQYDAANPDREFGKGNALKALERLDDAETAYREAIKLESKDGAFHFNLANVLKEKGRLQAACDSYRQAAGCVPVINGVYNNLGNTLLDLGQHQAAVEAFRQSLAQHPDDVTTLTNLATTLLDLSEIEQAQTMLKKAIQLGAGADKQLAVRQRCLSAKLSSQKAEYRKAIDDYRKALETDPDSRAARSGLATTFRWIQPDKLEPAIVSDLEMLCSDNRIPAQRFCRLIANQIRYQIKQPVSRLRQGTDSAPALEQIADIALLRILLSDLVNTDPELEVEIQTIRQALLQYCCSSSAITSNLTGLAVALAIQGFNNEYVCPASDEEKLYLDRLPPFDHDNGQLADSGIQFGCAVAAMYQSIVETVPQDRLIEFDQQDNDGLFAILVRRTVIEPAEERSIRSQIEQLGQIEDDISHAVRAQYEEHPYPRWFSLPDKSPVTYFDYLSGLFPHFNPPAELSERVAVLSAGCGTGQEAAMIAHGKQTSEVIGLDLSKTSLAHAIRMSRRFGLDHLRLIQGDILQVADLGRHFPVIETTGVLHHMREPLSGWQTLVDCLEPGGVMKVGLYSARASVEVNRARDWIRERGYGSDSQTVRAVRQDILSTEQSHPLHALRNSEDFYSVSACRDLIFHVQEASYTPAQLRPMLDQLRLEFIGFELPDGQTRQRYLSMWPDDPSMTDLAHWDELDQQYPDTFSGMLVFWCQRSPID